MYDILAVSLTSSRTATWQTEWHPSRAREFSLSMDRVVSLLLIEVRICRSPWWWVSKMGRKCPNARNSSLLIMKCVHFTNIVKKRECLTRKWILYAALWPVQWGKQRLKDGQDSSYFWWWCLPSDTLSAKRTRSNGMLLQSQESFW